MKQLIPMRIKRRPTLHDGVKLMWNFYILNDSFYYHIFKSTQKIDKDRHFQGDEDK